MRTHAPVQLEVRGRNRQAPGGCGPLLHFAKASLRRARQSKTKPQTLARLVFKLFVSPVFSGALAPPAAGTVGAARPFPSDIIWSARSCRASFSAFARSPNFNSFNTQPLACKSTQSVCHVLHSEIARGYQIIVAFWWAVTAVRTNVSKFLRSRTHGRGIYNTQKGI